MKQYTKLVFDLDDTLIDNKENVKYAFQKLMQEIGETNKQEKFEEFYQLDITFWRDWQEKKIVIPEEYNTSKITWKNWLRARRFQLFFKETITIEQASKWNDRYIEYLKEHVIPMEGTYEVIQKLAKKYEIIVATNGPLAAVIAKLEKIQIQDYVSVTFSSEEVGAMKPDNKFFEGVMEKAKDKKKEHYLVIGDSLLSDIRGANQIEMDCIWFNPKKNVLEQGYYPSKEINTLEELLELL